MDEQLFATGKRKREHVLGAEHVERALSSVDSFDAGFQHFLTEYCWGSVWGRDTLSDKQRSLNNLCLLAALNRMPEFSLHCRAALRNGVTLDELRDTLLQIAVYAGIPAGVEAFRLAREVLDAEGIVPPPVEDPVGSDGGEP